MTGTSKLAHESNDNNTENVLHCVEGILLPAWEPLINVSKGTVAFRGIVYIIVLIYLFVGVAILADKFMASIEMITSKKREVKMKDRDGKVQTVVVRVWNETVANLTLMALGCSCPEILLSSIEIIGKGFEAGELGPGSTVGSAAFNLFVIIGVCNWAIPDGQVRKIKRVSVFLVTATWSIFAYLWLYLITSVISPGVIDVWEAVLTFLFFPMTVFSAYVADRHVHIYEYLSKTYRMGRNGVIVETTTDEAETVDVITQRNQRGNDHFKKFAEETENQEMQEFEDHRRAFIILLKNLRRKYPTLKSNQLELMACKEMLERGPKSNNAFYKTVVSRLINGHDGVTQNLDFTHLFQDFHQPASPSSQMRNIDRQITKVFFSPGHYTVMENVGELLATVVREDGDLTQQVMVDYATESGEAVAGKDFEPAEGTIVFEPGITAKTIQIRIIDDDLYEEDQHFYIRLFNLRTGNPREYLCGKGDISDDAYVTVADVHEEAPSYSTTVDIEIEDTAPPRYSVTAREILSALKQNKNLRRPSWFHYDESSHDDGSDSDDDVFEDAVSHLEDDNVDQTEDPREQDITTVSVTSSDEAIGPSRNTSIVSVTSSNKITPFKPALTHPLQRTRGSVRNRPAFAWSTMYVGNSSDSDDEVFQSNSNTATNNVPQQSLLRLVCPSLATVMILDDDHHGIFSLTDCSVCLTETVGTYSANIMRCGGTRGRVALSYRTDEGTAKAGRDYQHIQGEILFEDGEAEKSIAIPIMLESLYEKDVLFYFTIGEPKLVLDTETEENIGQMNIREYSQLSEEQRTALKGRPQLGEVTTVTIRLKESKEFKNTVDKLIARANATIQKGRSSWKQQFLNAFAVKEEEDGSDEDSLRTHSYSWKDYAVHYITFIWKLVFAIIPPECIGGGYPCFVMCVVCIGVMTSLIGDIASHLGCTVGLKDSVTALAFVSLGTSLPDLFASKVSAVQNKHADASISNVTGSNAVNVFLGVGVAWLLAAFHHSYHGTVFRVDSGTLAFSVTLYCVMAVLAIVILLVRRCDKIGGELGGAAKFKLPTSVLLIVFFIVYIILSSFEAYEYIEGF